MFNMLFPKHWSTLKKLIWLKAAALSSAVQKTVTAAIVHITDALAGPAQNVTIAIDPVQAGTGDPSPDNVRPITGWTGCNIYDDPAHGGLIWWNQTGYAVDGTVCTYSLEDGVYSVHPTGNGNRLRLTRNGGVYQNVVPGHKYFETVTIKSDGEHSVGFQNFNFPGTLKTKSAEWTVLEDIQLHPLTGGTSGTIQLYSTANTDYQIKAGTFMFFDLTAMFGAGNEPSTVAEFRALFPKSVYAYNAGESTLVSKVNGDPYWIKTIAFPDAAGTVYGGTLDVTNGVLTVFPYYASYNGEGLVGPWISSMDKYAVGVTPTIGAQVVDLGGAGTTYQLTPQEVTMLLGNNTLWADTGDMTLTYMADGRASDIEALGILLAGRYVNGGNPDEATDEEALDILLGR